MSKQMIALVVGAVWALGGCATQTGKPPSQADIQRERDYRAALRHCDQLGSAERSTCIEDAKARYGYS